jgi:hypothetical protein
MTAYLAMMAPRLVELRRVLKETGSIYLHYRAPYIPFVFEHGINRMKARLHGGGEGALLAYAQKPAPKQMSS